MLAVCRPEDVNLQGTDDDDISASNEAIALVTFTVPESDNSLATTAALQSLRVVFLSKAAETLFVSVPRRYVCTFAMYASFWGYPAIFMSNKC